MCYTYAKGEDTHMTLVELKREIRKYKKAKKDLRVGSFERKEINKKLKILKKQYVECAVPDEGKQKLIDELIVLYSRYRKPILVDFRNFTTEQLAVHLAKLKGDDGYGKSHS
jgi:hypothetical protein